MSSQEKQQRRREQCRREVLAYLANRSVATLSADAIFEALKRKFRFTIEEVKAGLEFHRSAGRILAQPDPFGATLYYKVTADGILFHERNPPNK